MKKAHFVDESRQSLSILGEINVACLAAGAGICGGENVESTAFIPT